MKIKLDENVPAGLKPALVSFGHDVDTVMDEGVEGRHDPVVWAATKEASRFLITQDLDFSDLRAFAPGTHPGILLLRLRDPSRTALMQKVVALFQAESVESWRGCFVVATDHKLRIRR